MSWSVQGMGKPAALKANLVAQFASAKASTANIPHEAKTVELAEESVNLHLDFLAETRPNVVVTVSGNGSATTNQGYEYSAQQLEVKFMGDILE